MIQAATHGPRPGRRILVVDNYEDTVESLALLLEPLGYEVQTAPGGHEAITAALARRPDVVLLDIGLPRMDGWKVARRLRRQVAGPLVIIAVTGFGRPEDSQRSHDAGIDDHLVKPVDLDALLALLARCEAGPIESGGCQHPVKGSADDRGVEEPAQDLGGSAPGRTGPPTLGALPSLLSERAWRGGAAVRCPVPSGLTGDR
jgi:CheY-like chemotaxis protein